MNESKKPKIDARGAWEFVLADSSRVMRLIGILSLFGGVVAYVQNIPKTIEAERTSRESFERDTDAKIKIIMERQNLMFDWRNDHMQNTAILEQKVAEQKQRVDLCCPFYRGRP